MTLFKGFFDLVNSDAQSKKPLNNVTLITLPKYELIKSHKGSSCNVRFLKIYQGPVYGNPESSSLDSSSSSS